MKCVLVSSHKSFESDVKPYLPPEYADPSVVASSEEFFEFIAQNEDSETLVIVDSYLGLVSPSDNGPMQLDENAPSICFVRHVRTQYQHCAVLVLTHPACENDGYLAMIVGAHNYHSLQDLSLLGNAIGVTISSFENIRQMTG